MIITGIEFFDDNNVFSRHFKKKFFFSPTSWAGRKILGFELDGSLRITFNEILFLANSRPQNNMLFDIETVFRELDVGFNRIYRGNYAIYGVDSKRQAVLAYMKLSKEIKDRETDFRGNTHICDDQFNTESVSQWPSMDCK